MKLLIQVQAVNASDVAVHADGQNAADEPGTAAPADPYEPDAAAAAMIRPAAMSSSRGSDSRWAYNS
jgi:hypothetical protein